MPEQYAFISHAIADDAFAHQLCSHMEERGIRCWVGPRDIPPGEDFAPAISNAIKESSALVLVLSEAANQSQYVLNHVGSAARNGKDILVIRVRGTLPSEDLQRFIGSLDWIDAWDPPDEQFDQLCEEIEGVFSGVGGEDHSIPSLGHAPPLEEVDAPLVFLSARSEDYGYAEEVHRFLTDSGVKAFFSHVSLPELGSSDYRREIDQALDDTQHLVVITSSRENVLSQWVEAEWGFFINEKRSGRKPGNLITLVVGSMEISELPPSLRYYEVITYGPEALEKLLRYVDRMPKAEH
jgi:hypothetical protein